MLRFAVSNSAERDYIYFGNTTDVCGCNRREVHEADTQKCMDAQFVA